MRCNTKKSQVGNIWSLRGHTFSNVNFLRIKTVQSPSGKIFVVSIGLHRGKLCNTGEEYCLFLASIFASMLASDTVNIVGCLSALVGR